jgi:hypothetical protein
MKFTLPFPGLKVLYGPTDEDLKNSMTLGQQIGQMIKGQMK